MHIKGHEDVAQDADLETGHPAFRSFSELSNAVRVAQRGSFFNTPSEGPEP